ncbi:MAG TPA: hypothetical protein VH250_06715 [Granulicella sp.]|nr:hypothetical protein [Granulicella sp.]
MTVATASENDSNYPSNPKGRSSVWAALIRMHDVCFSDRNKGRLKRLVVKISLAGFAVHLGLIFLAHCMAQPPLLVAIVGSSYLSAISTPFNMILFYEVLTLIAAMPASTTRSIANQFEIVSLIFLRDVFKDIANASQTGGMHGHPQAALPVLFDMCTGFLMFTLATVFQQVAQRQVKMPKTPELAAGQKRFIEQKKVVAIGLTGLLLALAAYRLGGFAEQVWEALWTGRFVAVEAANFFYNDLFTVMIFTDVVILVLSLVISGRYEMVFRNAAFVISVILIRLSLTEEQPYGAAVALLAMVFGILTLLVFNYHSRLRANEMGSERR